MAFIDADHQHPCPLVDLLQLARVTRPGRWIVLHDIRLGSVVLEAQRAGQPLAFPGQYGAEWLFDAWPFRKVAAGNIGAVELPAKKHKIRPLVKALLRKPFEIAPQGHRRFEAEIKAALRQLN